MIVARFCSVRFFEINNYKLECETTQRGVIWLEIGKLILIFNHLDRCARKKTHSRETHLVFYSQHDLALL